MEHGGPADIDVLDSVREGRVGTADGLFEWIKIDDQQVDWLDVMLAHDLVVGAAPAQQPAMNNRVQGLDPPAHDLRKPGSGRHLNGVDSGRGELPAGAAGCQYLDAHVTQCSRKWKQIPLVRNADKRTPHFEH